MANEIILKANGEPHAIRSAAETPPICVLRHELGLNGPQFGCVRGGVVAVRHHPDRTIIYVKLMGGSSSSEL